MVSQGIKMLLLVVPASSGAPLQCQTVRGLTTYSPGLQTTRLQQERVTVSHGFSENSVRMPASSILCVQLFHSRFSLIKPNGLSLFLCSTQNVVQSIAQKKTEDACGKGWSLPWKISPAHFNQQLKILFQGGTFSTEEISPNYSF